MTTIKKIMSRIKMEIMSRIEMKRKQLLIRKKGNNNDLVAYIEEFNYFNGAIFVKGWAYSLQDKISHIGFINKFGSYQIVPHKVLPSDDIVKANGSIAKNSRFSLFILDNIPVNFLEISLVFKVNNAYLTLDKLYQFGIERGPYGNGKEISNFFNSIKERQEPVKILEIGSRARSGISNKDTLVPKDAEYIGIDILEGDGVDFVADAHDFSHKVQQNYFDYVFSLNTFEHLVMPWKVVIEINKVLKMNGIVMIFTHQTFPLHDEPWDFWRFSDTAWHGLFNKHTGFEITETSLCDPVSIVPKHIYAGTLIMDSPAYVHSMVVAKKISNTKLSWDVPTSSILDTIYPE